MSTFENLRPRIIPCLDVRDGRVVKGVKFQNLRDAGDPAELAARYESDGADELVMLDVSATVQGRVAMLETIQKVRRQLSIPLTVGGGVKSVTDAESLLSNGSDKVSVNSAAVSNPELVSRLSQRFGAQCTVVAIDAVAQGPSSTDAVVQGPSWIVATRSGTERQSIDAIEWSQTVEQLGAGEILLTSWDRDGTRDGYDLRLLAAASSAVSIPVIASGGADSALHLKQAFDQGAHAVLAASIFHDQDCSVRDVKHQLRELGIGVRI